MKKLLCTLAFVLCGMLLFCACSKDGAKQNEAEEKITTEEEKETEMEKVTYTKYQDLTDAFMQVCANGDVEGVYALYYDDYLTKTVERMVTDQEAKKNFNAALAAEMQSYVDFVEYPYGGPELNHARSPLGYANEIYANSNGGITLPFSDSQVKDCVNLRVYREDGSFRDHFMIQLDDGLWYFIV